MASLRDVAQTLGQGNLVPGSAADVIPMEFEPTTRLEVSFGGRDVDLGNMFRANECVSAPSVRFKAETEFEDASYTLLLIDPDAPTPDEPKFAYWRHWVVSGLRPDATTQGHTLTQYLGPGPKDESGPHRYLFLLFREAPGLALTAEDVGGQEFVQRRSFDAAGFIRRHDLRLVAVNWMRGVGDGWKE